MCIRDRITGVEDFGLFAQGLEIPAEGLVPLINLPDDRYDYDKRAHALVGRRGNRFRLGDKVEVEIFAVDMDERKLELKVVGTVESNDRPNSKDRPISMDDFRPKKDKEKKGKGKGKKEKGKKKKRKKRK